ncbi:dicarboxylate/amino acid:cation symporter [Polymorphobacter fuscus]|uniref:Cation:dicarboxylase symporter family transporter n=1 Tax=Sandarakinorhabdus fusca TaxID=1439888 RepID=A0A7C9KYD1_9SPHN|nr:dicarboxylate/amino acid:cation symporter [Polymorphobacter fuscus]KAB7647563.1 dicarboxylate/amino acid:cation symporter [Polymorphobacter fuscus]MQT16828.1 cation:dicarboxylase symporter family transporter [Polymorphobacter fuscus]NJC09184.1 Na+/H+-dicarboxylate symporter [Polymorphobacter fuscus]
MKTNTLTRNILIALVTGILCGWLVNLYAGSAERAAEIANYLSIVTEVFLRLIKMIIAPLVLSTLTLGIAHMGGGGAVGRTFGRTMAWFITASVVSLALGILMVNILQPGVGVGLAVPPVNADSGVAAKAFDLKAFVSHIVPQSIFEAMATNEVLQIVVFSLFAGIGLISIGEQGRPIIRGLDALMHLMLRITGYVMQIAPLAVFAAVASSIAVEGLSIIIVFGRFIGGFYLALALLWVVLLGAGSFVIGIPNIKRLVMEIREPFLITFATASSEASYPKLLEALERFGVPNRIASFVLPLGYSFNLDGSMMYCAFASIFIAQAYGIDLTLGQEFAMLGLLMITSKGIAGVPRASLVVIAATLPYFNIPEAGLLLVLAVDHFLDMGRSATNVIGNAVATAVVAKWDKEAPEVLLPGEA